ncbi:MAG: NAD(+) synthase [Oscillospiraceae bacterium]|nr:NAD(+) synthase [Oscillospiraceae bacterium]
MNHGFVKCAAVSAPVRVADCAFNAAGTVRAMEDAAARGVRVLALPELGLTGYTCGDLFGQQALLTGALEALRTVRDASRDLPVLVYAGLPLTVGTRLYNCAAAISGGHVLAVVPKTHLPNYGEFYERRWFAPAPQGRQDIQLLGETVPFGANLLLRCESLPELVVGCEICEDLWAPCPPSVAQAAAGATLIVNLSASNEVVGKDAYRRELVKGQSARLSCAYLYCSCGDGESTTDLVFSGHQILSEDGTILAERRDRAPGLCATEFDVCRLVSERRRRNTFTGPAGAEVCGSFALPRETTELTRFVDPMPFVPADEAARRSRCEDILDMQAAGLKKRVEHAHCRALVVGLSGGLDSTLALLVSARAMDALGRDRKDILAVTMPCFGTTSRTRDNAARLAELLGVSFQTVPIGAAVEQHFRDIGLPAGDRSVTYENSQARERTQVLMDIANRLDGLVVGTGDLSELALGWATYNGDHMSMYGVNASVPKTLVRHMVRHAADTSGEDLRAVLLDILDTPVSPELLPPKDGEIAQKTEDLVGPYELHDFFLCQVVRFGFPPDKVCRLAKYAWGGTYDDETILRWLRTFYRRFFQQQFKRSCLPDGPKIGSVALSPRGDWRMPSDACAELWLAQLERL